MSENMVDKTLNLYPIDYPFETLITRMEADPPKLILDPDFQRKYKWDKDGWERASKFIESCLMRIPLPSCYFAEDKDNKHLVIDGVQRLTTIKKFFSDEFSLEGMTVFKELEGKKFSELGDYKADLESTTIRCIVLRKENSQQLIREIFSRLNQGAVALSDQEIRHALYPGSLDKLLVELSQEPLIANFGLGTNPRSTKDSREAEEQVLRFFAFIDDMKLIGYDDVLRTFLDQYMELNSNLGNKSIGLLRKKFLSALSNCELIFDENVFADVTRNKKRKGLVHYDLLMPTVGLLEEASVKSKAQEIRNAYQELCKSPAFRKTLSSGLQKKSSIISRREMWEKYLKSVIGNV